MNVFYICVLGYISAARKACMLAYMEEGGCCLICKCFSPSVFFYSKQNISLLEEPRERKFKNEKSLKGREALNGSFKLLILD